MTGMPTRGSSLSRQINRTAIFGKKDKEWSAISVLIINAFFFLFVTDQFYGSKIGRDCGSVGRAVASDTGGPQFETSNRQNLH